MSGGGELRPAPYPPPVERPVIAGPFTVGPVGWRFVEVTQENGQRWRGYDCTSPVPGVRSLSARIGDGAGVVAEVIRGTRADYMRIHSTDPDPRRALALQLTAAHAVAVALGAS